jgi:tetratricopeptide (TPR) repeat protein
VLGVAALVSAVVMWQARAAPVDNHPCAIAAPLAGTWDLATRVRLRAAAIATGEPSAAASSTLAATALEENARGWLDARSQVCADTRERHTQTEAVLQLKLACLDRQKDNLDALVALLESPDRATVKQAPRAVRQLHRPTECTNARSVSYVEPPALAIAPKAAELRKRLSRANALLLAARPTEAVAVLRPLTKEARQLGYGPLLAEVLYTLENAYGSAGDFTKSDLLVEAERVAVASRADVIAARVAADNYWLSVFVGIDRAKLDALQTRAHDLVEREGDLEAEANYAAGDALNSVQRGDYTASVEKYVRAIELGTQLFGADNITVLTLQQNHAVALSSTGQYAEAANILKAVIDKMQRAYGDDSDDLAAAWDSYGTTLSWLGRYDEANAAFGRASNTPSASNFTVGVVLCDRARVLVAQGKFDEAVASCQHGLATLKKEGIDGTGLALEEDPCAASYLAAKRLDEALTQSRVCLADFRKSRDHDAVDMVPCLAVEGATLVELSKPRDAISVLEQALALQAGTPAAPGVLANLQYQLARALVATKGDRARPRELVDKAREELARYPFKKPLLDELDTWRTKHAADLR